MTTRKVTIKVTLTEDDIRQAIAAWLNASPPFDSAFSAKGVVLRVEEMRDYSDNFIGHSVVAEVTNEPKG